MIAIAPLGCVVFVIFLVIGMAMPVLPLHIHADLGLGTFVVGLVAGSQFAASLLSRIWAGNFTDRHGPRRAINYGLVVGSVAGMVYLASLLASDPVLSAAILVAGRGVLGAAESCIITGALGWGLALGGSENAGKVIAWMGMPMFAAFALGAPLGTALFEMWGFAAIGLATLIAPMAGYMFIRSKPVATSQHATAQAGLGDVLRAVRLPGLALALCSMGFGSITIFIALLFSQRGWSSAWAAFTLFSVAFIIARVVLGHLPDRIGGAKVAFFSIIVEAIGQALIWLAPAPGLALIGATLTGLGYSLAYPALGLEAVRRVPPKNRALAMGTFTASLDLTLALAGPGLGVVASATGIGSVYLVSTLTVGSAAIISFLMMRQSSEQGLPVSEHRA